MLTLGNFPLEVGAFIVLSLEVEMRSERMDNFTVVSAIVRGFHDWNTHLIIVSRKEEIKDVRSHQAGHFYLFLESLPMVCSSTNIDTQISDISTYRNIPFEVGQNSQIYGKYNAIRHQNECSEPLPV